MLINSNLANKIRAPHPPPPPPPLPISYYILHYIYIIARSQINQSTINLCHILVQQIKLYTPPWPNYMLVSSMWGEAIFRHECYSFEGTITNIQECKNTCCDRYAMCVPAAHGLPIKIKDHILVILQYYSLYLHAF